MYTLLNANSSVTCAEICEDSSLLGVGFTDSIIKVWSLTPQKLRAMKSAEALQDVDREAGRFPDNISDLTFYFLLKCELIFALIIFTDDVLVRMMDDKSTNVRSLCGHSGPVYKLSFSPDRTLLLSCSEDATSKILI